MKKIVKYTIFTFILISILIFCKNYFFSIKDKKIYTPNKIYIASVAKNENDRTIGLSNTTSLNQNTAKLFIFERPDLHGFWMKDMNYPIDIVFLNENMVVVSYIDNLEPSSYPNVFYPEEKSLYVLEMNKGQRLISGLDKGIKVYYK